MPPSCLTREPLHVECYHSRCSQGRYCWNWLMLLCRGPTSVDNPFQSNSANPASLRNSLTDPGPNPAKWLLKKMNPCLKRFDFSSSVSYHFFKTWDWSFCVPPKLVMVLSPTIRR